MVEPSVLQGTLGFFERLGLFDVVLPFILVFTMVYAILEKTKVYGLEKVTENGKQVEYPRKNLNSMTAFVIAFFVVASSQIVAIINQTLQHVVLLLVLIICFMLLVGALHTGKDPYEVTGKWRSLFMIIIFIAIIFIFLNAIGVLSGWWEYLMRHWSSNAVAGIGLFVLILVFMLYVTHEKKPEAAKKEG
jgi:peptidoglycan/LPS O-acetylase OafA/YrhL